jgi:Phage integrase, N-terminal SAM-like domain
MSFRSGQSGTVVRKGQMWHGRYYVDIPGEETRHRASVPLGSIHAMKKTEARRKLRALLEEMGLNRNSHLERTEAGARTFRSEAAWWKENRLPIFKPSCQETMGSHLDKYLLPRFGSLPIAAIDERRVQEFIADLSRVEYTWPNGVSRKLSPKSIRNVVGVLKQVLGERCGANGVCHCLRFPLKSSDVSDRKKCFGLSMLQQANGEFCLQHWPVRDCDAERHSACMSKTWT